MACLDSTTLLDASATKGRQREAARALIADLMHGGELLCTTRFNVAELCVGIERSQDPAREAARVTSAVDGLVILEFDDQGAGVFGRIEATLLDLGRPVGDMNVLIASVALANGQRLVTRNPRHFADMPGLSVLSYG